MSRVSDTLLETSEARAVSIRYFNLYRLVVASVLAIFGSLIQFGQAAPALFEAAVFFYWLLAVLFAILQMRGEAFADRMIGLEVSTDILALVVFMYASGGQRSGVPFLMMTFVAGAGLIGRGRMVLGVAAFATISVLLEQIWRLQTDLQDTVEFTRAGMVSVGFFFVAIVSRYLAHRALINESLAASRGRDLERQRLVNARIIEDMQDGVLVLSATGALLGANPRAEEWLGVKLDHGVSLAISCAALAAAIEGRDHECYVEATDKSLRLRFVNAGEVGGNVDLVVYLEDVDQLKAQAQQLKLAALGRLTANIAHEIRNPLAAVAHAGELMAEEKRIEVQHRLLRIIHDNTARIDRIIRDVLELGRRDRGTPEQLNLLEFVRSFADELALNSAMPAGLLHIEADPREGAPLPRVWFDRVHLYQILTNLVGNARRYCSGEPGAVRVSIRLLDERRALLCVADDGPGICEEDRAKLFEPFFTSDPKGTGLGLYTARELAEANGASLNFAESAKGAEFHLVARRVA